MTGRPYPQDCIPEFMELRDRILFHPESVPDIHGDGYRRTVQGTPSVYTVIQSTLNFRRFEALLTLTGLPHDVIRRVKRTDVHSTIEACAEEPSIGQVLFQDDTPNSFRIITVVTPNYDYPEFGPYRVDSYLSKVPRGLEPLDTARTQFAIAQFMIVNLR